MPPSVAILVDTSTATPRREQAILAIARRIASGLRNFIRVDTAFRLRVWSARDRGDDGLTPNEVLDEAAVREAHHMAFAAARDLVRQVGQRGEFGVLMASNWDQFVLTLTDDFEFQAFALEVARRLRPTRVIIISSSNRRADRCARSLRRHGHRASVIPLPSVRLGRKIPMQATAVDYQYDGGACDVLFVPESTAMAASLDRVAGCVSQHTGVRVGCAYTIPRPVDATASSASPEAATIRLELKALRAIDFPVDISETTIAAELATLRQARSLLRQATPKLLVLGNDRFVTGQLLVTAAHEQGTRVLCVQDGMAADVPGWWFRRADFTAANGVFFRDLLVREGADPSSVTVTGQPRYDALFREAAELDPATARKNLGVGSGGPVVLFALQDTHDARYVAAIVNALMSIPEIRVVIRPHPWHSGEVFQNLESTYAGRVSVARERTLLDCLLGADLVVSQYSTMLVEAAALRIPGVAVSLSGSPDPIDLSKHGVAAGATDLEGFVAIVRRILGARPDLSAVRSEAEHLVGPWDGESTMRVAQLVLRLVEQRRE
jgi:hypothetical protein